jgi:hypothetical protein
MGTLTHILVFLIILFLYIHITNQYKKSEDLEIYEMDYTTNTHLQEVCDIKQPVLFEYKSINPEFFENLELEKLLESGSQDIKLKENEDYWKNAESVDFIVLPLQSSQTLMTTDTHARYFTENNESFVEESGLFKAFQSNDEFLKPSFTAITKYDIQTGSQNTITPLRYHTDFRRMICVTEGKIHVKMTPWRSNKYLYPVEDYENYEFFSPINVWKPQKKYFHEMDKIKFLEFDVNAGYVLYLPPYWWYSIKYADQPEQTIIAGITYNSIMNCAANLPNWAKFYIQQSNIKNRETKTLDLVNVKESVVTIDESKNEVIEIENKSDEI